MGRGPGLASVLACTALLAPPLGAQDSSAVKTKTAHITYLTGGTAYVDAGRLDGLSDTARVEVVRAGGVVAVLKVAFLASHKAACDIVRAATTLAVGDSVRFVPTTAPRDPVSGARTGTAPTAARGARSGPGLRGRVGLEYFVIRQRDGTNGGFSQPSFALRLDGQPPGASALTVAVDVRARRTYTILSDGTAVADGRNRVYQAALSLTAPDSPARLTVGRQISGNLGSVGLFDGVLAEVHQPDWSTGVFAGAEPEPIGLGFSSGLTELGGYAQRHSRPNALSQWALTFGASGSYQDAHANREFAFVQGSYASPRLSTFVTQEVDYYRSWKLLSGMRPISPTSTFAMLQYRTTAGLTLDGGFDNRRNVRLYRDVVNPETTFDDTYRQGAWAGVWLAFTHRLRLGLDARASSGGAAGRANSYTASLGTERLAGLDASLRMRSTYYISPRLTGWLSSAALGLQPDARLHLELNGGVRAERNPVAVPTTIAVTWLGADVDATLARAWYALLSATWQRGGGDGYDQLYGGLSVRF